MLGIIIIEFKIAHVGTQFTYTDEELMHFFINPAYFHHLNVVLAGTHICVDVPFILSTMNIRKISL